MEDPLGSFGERSRSGQLVGQTKHLFIYLRTSFTNHTHLEQALSTQAKSAVAAGAHAGPANS